MKTALFCIVVFLFCCHSAAPVPKQVLTSPVVTIIWPNDRRKALGPSDGTPTRQVAEFDLECSYQKPADWQFLGNQWTWVYPPPSGTENPADALPVLEAGKTNRYATGIADRPGVFRAQCTAKFKDPNNVEVFVTGWGTCAVVGGPITIQISPGNVPTWDHDNNDVTKSWFLEYFDYAHTAPLNLPAYIQRTQDCFVSAMLQPEGTEIFWDVPEDTYSYILETFINPSGFDLAAEAPFIDRKIAAFFLYDFYPTDNGVTWTSSIPVVGEDDTTSSTYLDKGAPVAMVSSISAHRPTSMTLDTSQPHYPAHPPGTDYCGTDYWYRLKDQTGSFFPGVWMNERFPTPSQFPPNFHTNDEDLFWTTLKAGTPGKMNAADWIVNIWPSGNQTTYHIDHQYWAASKATSGSSGIHVYDGLITLTPGQPGTAIQVP